MILSHRYLYNITDKLHPRPFEDLYQVVSDYRTFIHICRNKAGMSSLDFDYQQSLHTQESVVEDACRFELGAGNKRLYLFQGYFKIDDYIRQKIKETGGDFSVEIEAIDVEDSHKSILFRGDDNYVLYALDINTNFIGDQYKSFDRENSNLSVEIYEVASNQLIHKNFDVEESTLHGTAYFYGNNSDGYFQDYIEKNNEPTYRIEYSLAKDLNARDDFYYCDTVYNLQYRFRYIIFPIEFFSIIILIGSVIFLFYGAGHVDDKPGITLAWIDKVPLDIFAFVVLDLRKFLYI